MQEKQKAVLVIGAGVGGIRASLDLAESGHKVYLTDRSPGIGGALYQLDKWFPDNQCELCKLLPVFSRDECSQFCLRRDLMHPNIELMPYATVTRFSGEPGNFEATVNIKSRWVVEDKCTACDLCAQVCPIEVADEFERGQQKRKAIYVRNPQAIPNVYTIDREDCNQCGKCVEICPTKAVVLNMPDETRELSVGAVVVSVGSTEFDGKSMQQYGFGRYANVLSNIQLERQLASAGPTGGELKRPSDGKTPKKIAILQCVGSRDWERNYCSEVCCMYALKEAMMLRDRYPDADVTIFYMDIRAFGKDYYRFHLQAKEMGVKFARSRVSRIRENPKTKDLYLLARDESGKSIGDTYDMVVLSLAQCPSPYLNELSKTLGLATNEWGFIETPGFHLTHTSRPGVYVSGSASGPSDICETVIKASAAAGEAAGILAGTQSKAEEIKPAHDHKTITDEEAKIAIFICQCGNEISSVVDIDKTRDYVKKLKNVVLVDDMGFLCQTNELDRVKETVQKSGANRVIMAACAPYHYHRLFSKTLAEAGIGAAQWQLVNFREQLAWVHKESKILATRKAQKMVEMAVERLRTQEPLKTTSVKVTQSGLVIGGGISGMTSALELASRGYDVTLVEKTGELGGHSRNLFYDLSPLDPQTLVEDTIRKVQNNPHIKVMLNSELASITGHAGNFRSEIQTADSKTELVKHGAVIIASGAAEYQPTEHMFGRDQRVITQHELQKRLAEGKLGKPETVVMIQCVGSRNAAHSYCNRTCCSEAVANALKIKELSPETHVFVLNRDIMTYGFRERYFTKAREAGVLFHRFEQEKEPEVKTSEKAITITWPDPALPGSLEIDADLLVLSTGYVAEGNEKIAGMLSLPLTEDGFFKEVDVKFRPVDAVLDGIFITGLASAPRNLNERVLQAQAAAQRAANVLSRETLTSGMVVSEVDKRRCSACGLCVEACPFDARYLDADEHYAVVREELCQGCGACVAVCPNDAAKLRSQKDKQVFSMIEAVI
ncbi:MAG: FAD-dependent oxidoreductase [Dehalococcoidia bacterium]|nr:FAD-dependent oxidoreductase [Dehalococcoidia bacterium]